MFCVLTLLFVPLSLSQLKWGVGHIWRSFRSRCFWASWSSVLSVYCCTFITDEWLKYTFKMWMLKWMFTFFFTCISTFWFGCSNVWTVNWCYLFILHIPNCHNCNFTVFMLVCFMVYIFFSFLCLMCIFSVFSFFFLSSCVF